MQKEAKARIKINKLLEQSGWRFFDDEKGKANIVLENNVKITRKNFVKYLKNDYKVVIYKENEKRKLGGVIKGYTYFKNNDVLLAKITPCFENGKSGVAKNLINNIGFGSTEFIVFRPSAKALPDWIYYFISDDIFLNVGKNNMTGSAGQQRLSQDFVKSSKIPLPTLDVQKQIVAQIEEEQKLVDANKKLIKLFKGKIKEKIAEVWG